MTGQAELEIHDGSLYVAISNAIVRILREYTGRGPTKGELSLINKGRTEKVLEIRHEFQEAMREECIDTIAALTGRKVLAMLSANHIDPDLGAEIFVLEGPPDHSHRRLVVAGDGEPA